MRHSEQDPLVPVQTVTTAPESLDADQRHRLTRYLITMGIRTASFLLAIVTTGAVRWTFVALAVVLPYIAVVAVNAVRPRALGTPAKGAPTPPHLLGH